LRQLGRTFSWVDSERHPDAICDAVRNGKVILRTEPVPALELAQVVGAMVGRGLRPRARRESALDRTSPVEL
jgi:hypothetical protein